MTPTSAISRAPRFPAGTSPKVCMLRLLTKRRWRGLTIDSLRDGPSSAGNAGRDRGRIDRQPRRWTPPAAAFAAVSPRSRRAFAARPQSAAFTSEPRRSRGCEQISPTFAWRRPARSSSLRVRRRIEPTVRRTTRGVGFLPPQSQAARERDLRDVRVTHEKACASPRFRCSYLVASSRGMRSTARRCAAPARHHGGTVNAGGDLRVRKSQPAGDVRTGGRRASSPRRASPSVRWRQRRRCSARAASAARHSLIEPARRAADDEHAHGSVVAPIARRRRATKVVALRGRAAAEY